MKLEPTYTGALVSANGGTDKDVLQIVNREGDLIAEGQSPLEIKVADVSKVVESGEYKILYTNVYGDSPIVDLPSFKPLQKVASITLTPTNLSAWFGKMTPLQLTVKTTPTDAHNKDVVYTTSPVNAGLSVQTDGKVYVSDKLPIGEYKITATSVDGGKTAVSTLKVSDPIVTWTVDFKNKMANSLVENPNIAKSNYATTLLAPNSQTFAERTQAEYLKLMALDGDVLSLTNTVVDTTRQVLMQYNLVVELEKKLGTGIWQGRTSLSDKVNIARQLTSSLVGSNHARGSSPAGNKVMLSRFNTSTGVWGTGDTNATANIALLTSNLNTQAQIDTTVDNLGMVNFMLHAEKSNGTVASSVSVDYVFLTITVDLSKVVTITTSQARIG